MDRGLPYVVSPSRAAGSRITLFDGRGGQWQAEVLAMGRKDVTTRLLAHQPLDCELQTPVTLALGMHELPPRPAHPVRSLAPGQA